MWSSVVLLIPGNCRERQYQKKGLAKVRIDLRHPKNRGWADRPGHQLKYCRSMIPTGKWKLYQKTFVYCVNEKLLSTRTTGTKHCKLTLNTNLPKHRLKNNPRAALAQHHGQQYYNKQGSMSHECSTTDGFTNYNSFGKAIHATIFSLESFKNSTHLTLYWR